MINIKSFAKRKGVTTNSQSGSSSSSTTGSSPVNDWFYLNDDTGFVTCRYPLCSVDNIVAFADGNETGGGGGESSGGSTVVVDNLNSYSTTYALSANMGRNLKNLIDAVQTYSGGGGGTASSIDWQNITNKPSTFPPSAHTHAISDVTGLQNELTTLTNNIASTSSALSAHTGNNNIHVTAAEKTLIDSLNTELVQFLIALKNITTINNGTITFNANVNATGNVVAMS